MKTMRKQDINLNQFVTRKNISFLNERDGDEILRACRNGLAKNGEPEDRKVFQFHHSSSEKMPSEDEVPGSIFALFDHIKRSFDINEELVSGFKCKVYLPGSEGLIDPSTLVTHSRYICVLGVHTPFPKEEIRSEDKIAEAALLSVLNVSENEENVKHTKDPLKTSSSSSSQQKPKEVFTFSVYGMSKPLLLEQGQVAGIDGMFSNVVAVNFDNQRKIKIPPISNGYRETIVFKKPEKRIVLVLDIEQTAGGLLKSVEKMKTLMQKKKMFGF